jgi:hypothetical protein
MGVAEGRRNVETLAKLGPLGEVEERLADLEASMPRVTGGRVRYDPTPTEGGADDDEC